MLLSLGSRIEELRSSCIAMLHGDVADAFLLPDRFLYIFLMSKGVVWKLTFECLLSMRFPLLFYADPIIMLLLPSPLELFSLELIT